MEEIVQRESRDTANSIDELMDMKNGHETENSNLSVAVMADPNVAVRDRFLKYVQCHPLENSGTLFKGAYKDSLFFNFPSYIENRIRIKINRITLDVRIQCT